MNLNRLDISVFIILTVLTLLYTVLLSRKHNEKRSRIGVNNPVYVAGLERGREGIPK